MIEFERKVLSNGLTILVHEDMRSPLVTVNVLYKVGARDENPHKTGFAHLFEHLMFGGSKNIADFDHPLQMAGGDNNAFTNSDITNFYNVVPAQNIETVLWLESDRMTELDFSQRSLEVQKDVVVEEFKETCINPPYGMSWHYLSEMAYKDHPYRWPTIGLEPGHIADAKLDDVKDFFYKWYRPNNAIISIAGGIETEKAMQLVEKWFGGISAGEIPERQYNKEREQTARRTKTSDRVVPLESVYLAFKSGARRDDTFYSTDILSDVMGDGRSSRLYNNLVLDKQVFSSIDCFISGTLDPGLLIIEGKTSEGVSLDEGEKYIWEEINKIKSEEVEQDEINRFKNRAENTQSFSRVGNLNKAMDMAYFEMLGDAQLVNDEMDHYRKISPEELKKTANRIFDENRCCSLYYPKNN